MLVLTAEDEELVTLVQGRGVTWFPECIVSNRSDR